jgi:cellulose synthase/poly-beta-1,6-N-acetylglucosamine synthase-like glycosyltransferase
MILILLCIILFLCYAAVILYYDRGWRELPVFIPKEIPAGDSPRISLIIPARNEEKNIGSLLASIARQTYPATSFEVIIVDDHSTDRTAEIVRQFAAEQTAHPPDWIRIIPAQNENGVAYKKKAIETGIAVAKHEWILCTDADCIVQPGWIASYAAFITANDPVFVAAPVVFVPASNTAAAKNNLLFTFQELDFLSLQGITAASVSKKFHSMCNGANIAYRKDVFLEVGGFRGIDHIASGDDMLLMHKVRLRYPDRVLYLKTKSAIVETSAAATWRDFFNQRIRWASKASSYDDKKIFAVLVLVYLFNFSFLLLTIASFIDIQYFYFLLILWIAKTVAELPFMKQVSDFFGRGSALKYFVLFQPLHIGYTILAGFLGSFGTYEWKGRRVK